MSTGSHAVKNAIITGGASGIGAATVELLAARGACCTIFDIDGDGATGLTDRLNAKGFCCNFRVTDVSDETAVTAAVEEVAGQGGGVHLLVNSAASFISKGRDASRSDWDRSLAVNVRGCANVVAAASRHMPPGSAIVNVASISAHIAQPNRWTYNATKAAIVELTKCQALDFAQLGIRVNVVSPGWIWTPEVARAAAGDRAGWEPIWGRYHVLARLGEATEVANAIVFLLSDEASFITGAELLVDGGYSCLSAEGAGESSRFR